jgi:hypothetical protein
LVAVAGLPVAGLSRALLVDVNPRGGRGERGSGEALRRDKGAGEAAHQIAVGHRRSRKEAREAAHGKDGGGGAWKRERRRVVFFFFFSSVFFGFTHRVVGLRGGAV